MRRKDKKLQAVVLAAVVITIAALGLLFGGDAVNFFKSRDTQAEVQELYRGAEAQRIWNRIFPAAHAEEEAAPLSEPTATPAPHEDFAELYAQNQHLIGWMTGGGHIDYPVVQFDDTFYLDHDYFGNEDDNGTLFLNAANKLDPRDSVLLIHGHNMRSGAMFGDLDFYRDYSYLEENPVVTFRTIYDAEDVHYAPIAAFDISATPGAEGYTDIAKIRFDFDLIPLTLGKPARSTGLESYIASLRELSLWDSPVEADSTDEYIMLVTCSYTYENGRMLLVCRRLRDGETPESIAQLLKGE